ncbi:MAG TPA: diaminopimelate epimerase [Rhizomicrobium sp.]|jgi:diaminopimelate epimerase
MAAFYKMHGLGNDFVVFDARERGFALDEAAARLIADRRRGIGCDQVIVMERAKSGADAFMRIFNADGDEVESCGNAARCVAQLLIADKDQDGVRIDTRGGPLSCRDGGGGLITVDMGPPRFGWRDIPLSRETETAAFPLRAGGKEWIAAAVSVGNPHCVIFTENAEQVALAELGPQVEHHELFPARINVEFAHVIAPGRLRMRVWERGAGITQACGTGACATLAAAHRRGLSPRAADVVLDGGVLNIERRAVDDHILMTGPASLAFTGDVDLTVLESRA